MLFSGGTQLELNAWKFNVLSQKFHLLSKISCAKPKERMKANQKEQSSTTPTTTTQTLDENIDTDNDNGDLEVDMETARVMAIVSFPLPPLPEKLLQGRSTYLLWLS